MHPFFHASIHLGVDDEEENDMTLPSFTEEGFKNDDRSTAFTRSMLQGKARYIIYPSVRVFEMYGVLQRHLTESYCVVN